MPTRRKQSPTLADTLGEVLRGVRTMTGTTAFGLSAGALGTYGMLTAATGGFTQEGWGAGPVWLLMMAVGGLAGMIAGFMSVHWLRHAERMAYRWQEWLGLLVGLAAGAMLFQLVSGRDDLFMKCLIAAGIVPPCAAGGRLLAGALQSARQPSRANRPPKAQRSPRENDNR